MKKLTFAFNKLLTIHENAFVGLGNLKELILSNNKLTELSPTTFRGLQNLLFLDLSFNKFVSFHPETFCGLVNLKALDLRWNKLEDVNFLIASNGGENSTNERRGLMRLEKLCIGANPISKKRPDYVKSRMSERCVVDFNEVCVIS